MKAVVLVGGKGTRLRPLTNSIPKQLLPVAGRPMIELVVEHLALFGVDEVVLSMGYRPDDFLIAYPDGQIAGVRVTYVVEQTPLDTGGAIRYAASSAAVTESFLAVNGDVLTDHDYSLLIRRHRDAGAAISIDLQHVEDPSPFGVVVCDESGKVSRFVEKPPLGTQPSNLINAGAYVIEPEVLGQIADDRPVSIERETFPLLASQGSLFAFESTGDYWVDSGTPSKLNYANRVILKRRATETAVQHSPQCWVEPDATVLGDLVGPCLVMKGAVVSQGALVASSVISKDVVVGANARVTDSLVMASASVGAHSQIAGSVVGPGAVIGEESRLSESVVIDSRETVQARSVRVGDGS